MIDFFDHPIYMYLPHRPDTAGWLLNTELEPREYSSSVPMAAVSGGSKEWHNFY